MVEVFEKTASSSAAATNVGEISTAAATNIGNGEEIGEGLEPSRSLNQKADLPMSSIFGLYNFSWGDKILAMETVIATQRKNSTDIGK